MLASSQDIWGVHVVETSWNYISQRNIFWRSMCSSVVVVVGGGGGVVVVESRSFAKRLEITRGSNAISRSLGTRRDCECGRHG